jgi:hypothetical protein
VPRRRSARGNWWRKRGFAEASPCRFRRFRTEQAALDYLAFLIEKPTNRAQSPVRTYHCDRCDGYHLTALQDAPDYVERLDLNDD